ncbi:carboxylating nicotinate-nucleotide diphosphorylase [Methanolacinia petrolearia]|uniref:carboxylating nicotinate-nucleotide diphosphorylase n=1 Tax=Methanolacinia petrolearia TaxID=54120 RepID=UPI003BAA4AE9
MRINREILTGYLLEDTERGDLTSDVVVPDIDSYAEIVSKDDGIICGLEETAFLFGYAGAKVVLTASDGERVSAGRKLMEIRGKAKAVLLVERTALNIIGRMSGIATKTDIIVRKARSVNPKIRIAGTRKTSPGARAIDKKAIVAGGGDPHRYDLSDAFLIKDNHLAVCPAADAIRKAKEYSAYKKIEIEAESPADALADAKAGADIIMLDNMTPEKVSAALGLITDAGLRGRVCIEISGGIDAKNFEDYAALDIDVISMGALTHSVRNFDVSLDMKPGVKNFTVKI